MNLTSVLLFLMTVQSSKSFLQANLLKSILSGKQIEILKSGLEQAFTKNDVVKKAKGNTTMHGLTSVVKEWSQIFIN